MNAERQLLRDVGDQQFKTCPPSNFWPCECTDIIVTRLAVLRRFWPVVNSRNMPETFLTMCVWTSDPRETYAFSHSFSLC